MGLGENLSGLIIVVIIVIASITLMLSLLKKNNEKIIEMPIGKANDSRRRTFNFFLISVPVIIFIALIVLVNWICNVNFD